MITGCCSGCSLLKFRDGDETTYDEYRDCAGKLVLAKGGSLAFLGRVKASFCRATAWPESTEDLYGGIPYCVRLSGGDKGHSCSRMLPLHMHL